MKWYALYSEGVGLQRDHFQSFRLLKIYGSWRPSVKKEHFTGARERERNEVIQSHGAYK